MYDFYITMSYIATFVPLAAFAAVSLAQWRNAQRALQEAADERTI